MHAAQPRLNFLTKASAMNQCAINRIKKWVLHGLCAAVTIPALRFSENAMRRGDIATRDGADLSRSGTAIPSKCVGANAEPATVLQQGNRSWPHPQWLS